MKIYSIHLTSFPRKREKKRKFMFQRITRREIDNTHRVNGIS